MNLDYLAFSMRLPRGWSSEIKDPRFKLIHVRGCSWTIARTEASSGNAVGDIPDFFGYFPSLTTYKLNRIDICQDFECHNNPLDDLQIRWTARRSHWAIRGTLPSCQACVYYKSGQMASYPPNIWRIEFRFGYEALENIGCKVEFERFNFSPEEIELCIALCKDEALDQLNADCFRSLRAKKRPQNPAGYGFLKRAYCASHGPLRKAIGEILNTFGKDETQ